MKGKNLSSKLKTVFIVYCLLLTSLFFLLSTNVFVDTSKGWWDSSWSYCKKITVDHTLIDSNLVGFPLMFDNVSSDFVHAQGDGDDFAFLSYDNSTQYDHELEWFNVSGDNRLVAWVQVNLSSSVDTMFWVYYGNEGVGSQETPSGVWDSNYLGVYHLDDASGNIQDSTSNNNHATGFNGLPTYEQTGYFGYAVDLDGGGDYFTLPDSFNFDTGDFTIEGWASGIFEGGSGNKNIVFAGRADAIVYFARWDVDQGDLHSNYKDTGLNNYYLEYFGDGGGHPANDSWQYYTLTYDNSGSVGGKVRLNTTETDSDSNHGNLKSKTNANQLGCNGNGVSGTEWNGLIEEFRISDNIRNDSWFNATFHTCNRTTGFLTVGSEQGFVGNQSPSIGSESPVDDAVKQELNPQLSVLVNDSEGDSMTIQFWTNASGSWAKLGADNTSASNGTYVRNPSNMNSYETTYWWGVNATDPSGSNDWTNETYSFTTKINWDADVVVLNMTTTEDYYKSFVKHPLGSFQNDFNVYEVSRTTATNAGNPDYILWVNESSETFGVSQRPTGLSNATGGKENTGGQASFSTNGTIWYIFGGKVEALPFYLNSSANIYDVTDFIERAYNWEVFAVSTMPTVTVNDPYGFVMWRLRSSTNYNSRVAFRRFNVSNGSWHDSSDSEIVSGAYTDAKAYGVEQHWQKFDPRNDLLFLSMMFLYESSPKSTFGCYPFLYSDDNGTTWRYVNGSVATGLPVDYAEMKDDRVIAPHNHFYEGDLLGSGWHPSDIGQAPDDTFWLLDLAGNWTVDSGEYSNSSFWAYYWFWNGTGWEYKNLSTEENVDRTGIPVFSIGVTKDYMVFIFTNRSNNDTLYMKYSTDAGDTWSSPVTLDSVPSGYRLRACHYVQPTSYDDNYARFFYAYYDYSIDKGSRDNNEYRWVKINVSAYAPINNAPVLSNPSCSPSTGVDNYTMFYFNVTWADSDGDDPTDGFLKVNITRQGSSWYTNQSMSWISGSNTTGAVYSYNTVLSAGTYNYTFYASDGVDADSSAHQDEPVVSSQSYSIGVTQSDSPDLWFNLTASGHHTEYNVSASGQDSGTPAIAIENQGNVPINLTIKINTSVSVGMTLKWDDDNNPAGATAVTTGEVQIEINLGVSASENIWLWMDFVDMSPETGVRQVTITSSSGSW